MFHIKDELMQKIKQTVMEAKIFPVPQPVDGSVMFACTGCSNTCSSTCTGACRTGCSSTCMHSSSKRW